MKHVVLDFNFVRERVDNKLLKVVHIEYLSVSGRAYQGHEAETQGTNSLKISDKFVEAYQGWVCIPISSNKK